MAFGDRKQEIVACGPFTSDGDENVVMARAEGAALIKSVDVFASASVATHATNYITLKLVNLGTDGTGTTVIASASTSQTGGSAIAADTAFPLAITAAAATVADGEAFAFVRDEATTDASTLARCRCVVRYITVGPTS